MQQRMKTHPLDPQRTEALLRQSPVASLATLNRDGTPYVTPVHFVWDGRAAYFHGLPAGQKLENLRANPTVSLMAYRMDRLLLDEAGRPCETNTQYESVILAGQASVVEDPGEKAAALALIVQKYTPQLAGRPLPEGMVAGTAVVKIQPQSLTGKYYG